MYWLDIGFQKMQKNEVGDGTFPNSDYPILNLKNNIPWVLIP